MTATTYDKPLRMCVWELTLRCNAKCRYCGSSAGKARPDELTTDECLALADEMIALGLSTVTLSGGEPLMRDGFFAIAQRLIAGGVRTDVVTNGLLVDDEMAAQLAKLGLYGVTLSFDGPEVVHDRSRGTPGGYAKLMQAIVALQRHRVRVGAITHVNRINLPHLDELAAALSEAGVSAWRLQITIAPDDDHDARNDMLQPEQLPLVVSAIKHVQAEGKMACYGSHDLGYFGDDELAIRRAARSGPRVWHGCPAGLAGIGLLSDGGVNGCLSLVTHGEWFLEGNVRRRSLTELWRDPNSFAYSRNFRREDRDGVCGACRFLDQCRAGCTNLLFAVDPAGKQNKLCLHAVEKDRPVRGPEPTSPRPSIVVFVADGLRPDFLGCYGAEPTPNIDRLAAEGLWVKRASSPSPWTVPAIGSMFTGMAPHRLGLVKWRQQWNRAPGDLFSFLAGQGYAVGSFPFDRRHLFANQPQAEIAGISWDMTGVQDWIVGNHRRPSFTYIHWWGTHAPYTQKGLTLENWKRAVKLLIDALNRDRAFAVKLRELYRLAVRHLDQIVLPGIFREIEKGRGWENTIFAFTADHGECWCERYPASRKAVDVFDFHGRELFEENLRVPLLFAGATPTMQIDTPASHLDFAKTLVRLAGLSAPSDWFPDGVDLLDCNDERRPIFAVADRDFVDARQVPSCPDEVYSAFACRCGDNKLIRRIQTGCTEWYDLKNDPQERCDLAVVQNVPEELSAILEAEWARATAVEWNREEDLAIRKRLRSLGYI